MIMTSEQAIEQLVALGLGPYAAVADQNAYRGALRSLVQLALAELRLAVELDMLQVNQAVSDNFPD